MIIGGIAFKYCHSRSRGHRCFFLSLLCACSRFHPQPHSRYVLIIAAAGVATFNIVALGIDMIAVLNQVPLVETRGWLACVVSTGIFVLTTRIVGLPTLSSRVGGGDALTSTAPPPPPAGRRGSRAGAAPDSGCGRMSGAPPGRTDVDTESTEPILR